MKTIFEIRQDRMKELAASYGSQTALAEAINRSPAQVSQWINGSKDSKTGKRRGMDDDSARYIEKCTGKPRGWLDQPHDAIPAVVESVMPPGYVHFTLLDVRAAAGDGCEVSDLPEVIQRVQILESWAREKIGGNLNRIRLITAQGDSMRGTFDDGDLLFVDSTVQDFRGEGVYIIYHPNSGVRAKRLQRLMDGTMNIISDGKYAPETANAETLEQMRICGKVVASWRFSPL